MNNTKNPSDGFTIIEVILFIGVSSVLLVGAFFGITSALNTTQFNDTTDTTLSFFQKQYFEVATGVNVRDSGLACSAAGQIIEDSVSTESPGTSNCVILGRILEFSPGSTDVANKVTVKYLSSRMPSSEPAGGDVNAFGGATNQYNPRVSNAPRIESEFSLPWSALVRKAQAVQGATSSSIDKIAIMRSPVSERMMIYAFSGAPAYTSANLLSGSRTAVLCIQSDSSDLLSKKALLNIGAGYGQDLFTIDRTGNNLAGRCS